MLLPVFLAPAGYAALILEYALDVPLPYSLCGIVGNHHPPDDPQWILTGNIPWQADVLLGNAS